MESLKAMHAKTLRETTICDVPESVENPVQSAVVNVKNETPGTTNAPPIVSFDALSPNGQEIWIDNLGQMYRLRRTRQGKLILTK